MFIADTNNCKVRKIAASTNILNNFAGTSNCGFSDGNNAVGQQVARPSGVAVDPSGNVYIADTDNHRIRKVDTSNAISTVAGQGFASFSGDGLPATAANINAPTGVFVSGTKIYIADTGNNRVRVVDTTNGNISTLAGTGLTLFSGDGGPAISATVAGPTGVAVDSLGGNVLIADRLDLRVRKVDTPGNISTIAGSGQYKFGGDGSLATNAYLYYPSGAAPDSAGNLYVADAYNHRVRKVTPGGIISTLAGTGVAGYSGDGGPAVSATLNTPTSVAADSAGNIYVADSLNSRIRKITPGGVISTFAGNGTPAWAGDGGPAGAASLNQPYGISIDAAGNLYIGDVYNHRIRKVNTGGTISTVAGNGAAGFSGDSGAATNAQLSSPYGAAADAAGNIYIADNGNGRVRKVNSGGTISTYAGPGTAGTVGDGGLATSAYLNTPFGVTLDTAGNVYVADRGASRVRMIVPAGTITTVAGTGVAGYTGEGIVATSSALNLPASVAVDSFGNLFIADSGNDRVRRVANAVGTLNVGPGQALPGATVNLAINVVLGGAVTADSLSFGLAIVPQGAAPAITAPLTFTKAAALATPDIVDNSFGPGLISVFWSSLSPVLAGTVSLGTVSMTIPASAVAGQTYLVHITGANGTSGAAPLTLAPGANAQVSVGGLYFVGDGFPNALASTSYAVGSFGDSSLDNFDLIAALRAVTLLPGAVPPLCSDLFDSMDSFPVDGASRGGDGALNNFDLIQTLRRVTSLDTTRPQRSTRGLVCPDAAPLSAATYSPEVADGVFEFGAPQEGRVPVYFHARSRVNLAGLSFGIGTRDGAAVSLRFVPAEAPAPTIEDHALPGLLAVAWLEGFRAAPGRRILLGHIEMDRGVALRFYGVEGSEPSGRSIKLSLPH